MELSSSPSLTNPRLSLVSPSPLPSPLPSPPSSSRFTRSLNLSNGSVLSPRFTDSAKFKTTTTKEVRSGDHPLSGPETAMLAGIEAEQHKLEVCPTLDYLDTNTYVLEMITDEFYNPDSQKAISCVIRAFLKSPTRPRNPEEATILSKQLEDYLDEPELGRYITIHTVDSESEDGYAKQVENLIREAYLGIVYLNSLRDRTPAFKYIYSILVCGQPNRVKSPVKTQRYLTQVCSETGTTPYLIEESLMNSVKLAEVLDQLPSNEAGIRTVKSFMFQLLMAAYYAQQQGVTNIPFEVVARPVSPQSDLPFTLDNKLVHIATYGWVLVFNQFGGASFILKSTSSINTKEQIGVPESLDQAQARFIQRLLDLLNAVNPELARIVPYPDFSGEYSDLDITSDYFAEILVDPQARVDSLSCQELDGKKPCMTLTEFVQQVEIPFARLDSYVRSSVDRIDYLSELLKNTLDQDLAFIITPIMLEYIQALERIYDEVDPKIRERLFPDQRYFNLAINPDRYLDPTRFIIKPDYQFIQEVKPLMTSVYRQPEVIQQAIQKAIKEGQALLDSLASRRLPRLSGEDNLSLEEELKLAIQGLRDSISDIKYDQTTNALIQWYRKYIGPYPEDLTKELEETQYFKSRYQHLLASHPGILDRILSKIDTADQAILARLYDVFVEDLSDPMETSLKGFENRSTPEDRQSIINLAYQQKVLASDSIPVILGAFEPTVTFSAEPTGLLTPSGTSLTPFPTSQPFQPSQEFQPVYQQVYQQQYNQVQASQPQLGQLYTPLNTVQVPLTQVPLNSPQVSLSYPQVSLNSPQVPLSYSQVPLTQVPLSSPQVSLSYPQVPLNSIQTRLV